MILRRSNSPALTRHAQAIQCIVQNLLLKLRAYSFPNVEDKMFYSLYETLIIYPYLLISSLKPHFTWI